MKAFMMIIPATGGNSSVAHCMELTEFPNLDVLQNAVGGLIEVVPYWDTVLTTTLGDFKCIAYCNEEGKLLGLPYNGVATELWRMTVKYHHDADIADTLHGDVVVIFGDKDFIGRA